MGVALIDGDKNTAFTLSVAQTAPTNQNKKAQVRDEETRIDQYLQHLRDVQPYLKEDESYLAVDGFFSKKKFIDGVTDLKLHQIGKIAM